MSMSLLLTQLLNGLQLGVLLFLLAAGLTLVFGIMSFVNLAHGSLYMLGAYFAASAYAHTESFGLALLASVPVAGLAAEAEKEGGKLDPDAGVTAPEDLMKEHASGGKS